MKVKVRIRANALSKASKPLTKKDIQEAVCNGIIAADNVTKPPATGEHKIGFWKAVWLIIRGKGSSDSRFATALLAGMLAMCFNALSWLGAFIFVIAISITIQQGVSMNWNCVHIFGNVVALAFETLICMLLFLIAIIFRGAANDIKQEKDRDYVVALFSGIVSFVALIVSYIALIKE